ncbi:MAG: hypothetical protein HY929_00245 [Euryarchaeota archaeon]|nr:hypothetical protein [Euryarchaeota archaeon]
MFNIPIDKPVVIPITNPVLPSQPQIEITKYCKFLNVLIEKYILTNINIAGRKINNSTDVDQNLLKIK